MTRPVFHKPSARPSIDGFGAALLTAIMLIAVVMTSVEYAQVTGAAGPGAVAAAFASVQG